MTLQISGLQLRSFCIPLSRPLNIAGTLLTEREGLLLGLKAGPVESSSRWFWGEISPLAGLHLHDLAEVRLQTLQFITQCRAFELPLDHVQARVFLWDFLRQDYSPSLRFGLEAALLQAAAFFTGVSVAEYLRSGSARTVQLNALVPAAEADITEATNQVSAYSSVKLKVGRESLESDITRVRALSAALKPHQSLRLDANKSWSLSDALEFADRIADCRIEYIEEPLEAVNQLSEFCAQSGMKVALDESLQGLMPQDIKLFDGLTAFVIKPQSFGGWLGIQGLLRLASAGSIMCVISSAYESGLGLHMLAQFAAAANRESVPAGLDTFKQLKIDSITPAFTPSGEPMSVHLQELARISLRSNVGYTLIERNLK